MILRRPFKKIERWWIWCKFDKKCSYCGCDILESNFHVDHYYPIALCNYYIKLEIDVKNQKNLLPACAWCNQWKSKMHPVAFKLRLGGIAADNLFWFERYMRSQPKSRQYLLPQTELNFY